MNFAQLNECRIGFIGAGRMAHAIAYGLIHNGGVAPQHISASAPTNNHLVKFKELGCNTTNNNNEIFCNTNQYEDVAKVIFLCVKPDVIKKHGANVFLPLHDLTNKYGPIVLISVLAGMPISSIRTACGLQSTQNVNIKFARIMPNTACSIGSAVCAISRDSQDPQFDQFLNSLLSPLGLCQIVPESQLNVICGLVGSGIAFVYDMIQAMSDGALKMGLPRDLATSFSAQTFLGAAMMVSTTNTHPIQLRDQVTSPGGTTIHGLHAMQKAGVAAGIMDAVEAATKRANELSS